MRIPAIKAYTQSYTNSADGLFNAARTDTAQKINKKIVEPDLTFSNKDHDKILSRSERDFFIRLFPENSLQLQNHVLFNRRGQIENAAVAKGSIIDGRV